LDYFARLYAHIGNRMRLRRRTLYMTPKEVADKAGMSISTLRAYERNLLRPNFHQQMRIAHALEVDVFYFYKEMPKDLEAEHQRRLLMTP